MALGGRACGRQGVDLEAGKTDEWARGGGETGFLLRRPRERDPTPKNGLDPLGNAQSFSPAFSRRRRDPTAEEQRSDRSERRLIV